MYFSITTIRHMLWCLAKFCLSIVLCLKSRHFLKLPSCQQTPQCANITPSFYYLQSEMVFLLLWENWIQRIQIPQSSLSSPSFSSVLKTGPVVQMIRRIYGTIAIGHLLPASWRIKGKLSGWHWNRDYPVCAIWLQISTGCFLSVVQLLSLYFCKRRFA